MQYGSIDGGDYGEYSGIGFVELSKIFVMQDALFFRKEPSGRLHQCPATRPGNLSSLDYLAQAS